jgi:hypothetical protein
MLHRPCKALYVFTLFVLALPSSFAVSGTWSMAGVLRQPASNAVTLNDGRVLSVGSQTPSSTQVWSPTSRTWTAAANAPITFMPYTYIPVVLNDGRVLVTGYCQSGCNGASNTEIYNPATNAWTVPASQMAVSRYQHTATKLADGRVLVAGGCNAYGCATDTASIEVFNPLTNRWTTVASMVLDRADHTATLLANGKVLIAGGFSPLGSLAENETYDPATNRWAVNMAMRNPRGSHTATLLPNGKVLVTGGDPGMGLPQSATEVFNPSTGLWTNVGFMASVREYHQAVRLPSGKVLVVGGSSIRGRSWVTLATAELFDPATNRFTPTGSMANPRESFGLTLLRDGRVLAVGADDYPIGHGQRYPGDADVRPGKAETKRTVPSLSRQLHPPRSVQGALNGFESEFPFFSATTAMCTGSSFAGSTILSSLRL